MTSPGDACALIPLPRWDAAARVPGPRGRLVVYAEHINSTSITGMAVKHVLDVQLPVRDLDQAAAAFAGPWPGWATSGLRSSMTMFRQGRVRNGRHIAVLPLAVTSRVRVVTLVPRLRA